MLDNIGLFSYLISTICFTTLASLLLLQWKVKPLGPTLLLACVATAVWAGTIAFGTLAEYPPIFLMQLTELARNACWLYFLLQLLGIQGEGEPRRIHGYHWRPGFWFFTVIALAILVAPLAQDYLPPQLQPSYELNLVLWLSLAVLGMLLIEQLYRNATPGERWSLKYLCLSLGALFAYDFFMYAEALLLRKLDASLWQARGLVYAIVSPWLAVAMARNSSWRMNLHLSRDVVFHSVTLMGSGLYLIGMAAVGYFIKFLGGSWGGVLQLAFLAAAIALLISLLFSGKFRAILRVQLSKHFFSYQYDYREEWLKFTKALASLSEDVPEGIVSTMAPLVSSPAGLLWGRSDTGTFRLVANWETAVPNGAKDGLATLPAWLQETDWVIDLNELQSTPDLYDNLSVPEWIMSEDRFWLMIPLVFGEQVEGILLLKKSDVKTSINWEDRDLLKTAGRQAASHLAQYLASQALVEARQFEAFNRLSAYVIHDLKNILAQQSLIVSNAAKHRDNPAFIDDMIGTVENSVARMQRLMEQMRTGLRSAAAETVNLAPLLTKVVAARGNNDPKPQARLGSEVCIVHADSERLSTVFNHLIQNAQEATDPKGSVTVHMRLENDSIAVDIIDTGSGMDEDFIDTRLFKPFESTKGLTGMGIGVFESREYIRQIGGDIQVSSTLDEGSIFHVTLPLAAPDSDTETPPQNPSNAHSISNSEEL